MGYILVMHYQGGKTRIAKAIAASMLAQCPRRDSYYEPFVGGASVAALMVPQFTSAYLSDISPDLILLWKALQSGWDPPTVVTRADYYRLKESAPSALRGFVGYGCSFRGRFFQGYAYRQAGRRHTYAEIARHSLMRQRDPLRNAHLFIADYRAIDIAPGSMVYCDPPYRWTKEYPGTPPFDSDQFWAWAEDRSRVAQVFVSEIIAPLGWKAIWQGESLVTMNPYDNARAVKESLWVKT